MKNRQITPFGRAVKKALVDKDMTLKELANLVGASPNYIGLIIYGERPRSKYIPAISRALGLIHEEREGQTA